MLYHILLVTEIGSLTNEIQRALSPGSQTEAIASETNAVRSVPTKYVICLLVSA